MRPEYILLITLGCFAMFYFRRQTKTIHRQESRIQDLGKQIEQLTTTTNVLCSSAVGVDKRVIKLERNGRDLVHRQEHIESSQQTGDRPYGEAIEMVHKGARVSRLMDELGLSKSEAELLVRLHGVKKAG
jgi:predicted RNase H-like nuclease (RuvC/YqgF family)